MDSQSNVPQVTANPFSWLSKGIYNLSNILYPQQNPQTQYNPNLPGIKSTNPDGTVSYRNTGTSFSPNLANTYNKTTTTPSTPTSSTKGDLNQYLINANPTPAGGSLTTDGSGNILGHKPAPQFSISTDGNIGSDALGANTNINDILKQKQQYQDYVDAVAQAQGYSPEYIQALKQQYGTQAQGAYLGTQQAALNANLATGMGFSGSTIGEAQAKTGIEQNLLAQQQALNTQQGTQAAINLNAQQLARTGNIAAAQTQLQYNPVAVTGQNAMQQWQQYSQNYPGVVPAYNQSLSPQDNALIAQQAVQNSPQFRSQFQQTYQTPGGGLGIYNKLGTNLLKTNADGTINLVSGAEASLGTANANAVGKLTDQYNTLKIPFEAANSDFTAMTTFMRNARINNSSIPLINQVANAVKAGILQPGAVKEFGTYIQSLRANYTQLLRARGETPTEAGNAANQLVPDNLSIPDLMKVQEGLNTNGRNILDATQKQLQDKLSQLPGASSVPTSQGGANQNIGSSWANL